MKLRELQSKFVLMVADLINYASSQGYCLTFGDAFASTGHKINSNHYKRLAIDFNLFKDGKYLTKTEDHRALGEYWESIGGAWGGRFGDGKSSDGNHYSVEWYGSK